MGVLTLGPLLLKHGTEPQKCRFLPRILSGEGSWAPRYSEPNGGSDLAALQLEVVDAGTNRVLN